VENVIREAELDEMEKKWREENQKILSAYPADAVYPDPVPAATEQPLMTALPSADDQPTFPFEAAPIEVPGAPDDDPLPPPERPLP
ncbi:MAG TPA: hypothetical protein VGR05_06030, partial [Sphingomicrobium sp.]|nr:hypothetical protein [Sphingomicrobium sp.]